MSTTTFPARVKRDGNINRIKELENHGCSADDIKACFARENIKLTVRLGDIPLLANLPELERKALSKKTMKTHLSQRPENNDPEPTYA